MFTDRFSVSCRLHHQPGFFGVLQRRQRRAVAWVHSQQLGGTGVGSMQNEGVRMLRYTPSRTRSVTLSVLLVGLLAPPSALPADDATQSSGWVWHGETGRWMAETRVTALTVRGRYGHYNESYNIVEFAAGAPDGCPEGLVSIGAYRAFQGEVNSATLYQMALHALGNNLPVRVSVDDLPVNRDSDGVGVGYCDVAELTVLAAPAVLTWPLPTPRPGS